jgi:hypothetical protein
MKSKLLGIFLTAAFLVAGVAAPGHAYFSYGDLVMVAYDTTGTNNVEVAVDLGSINTLLGTPGTQSLSGSAIPLSDFPGETWAGVNVAYMTVSGNSSAGTVYLSSTDYPAAPTSVKANGLWSGWNGHWSTMTQYWQGLGSGSAVVGSINGTGYYGTLTGQSGNPAGSYNGFLPDASGEIEADTGTPQYLYEWTSSSIKNVPGTLVAGLSTEITGAGIYPVLTSDAVPVPPSALLMLPGLLGLFGLRRKIL